MKRTRLYAIILLSAMLASPFCEAGAAERGRRPQTSSQGQNHNSSNGRPSNNNRPTGNGRPAGNSRPSNGGTNHKPNRPNSGNHNTPARPPQNNHRPPQTPPHHHPKPTPPKPPHYGHHVPSGWHHHPRPWRPATPPRHYRPYSGWPVFRTVLGITFGSTILATINGLIAQGYNATNYNGDVYVNNVNILGVTWPYAVLSYNNAGALCASQFTNYTPTADPMLYNRMYQQLCNTYGAPYSSAGGTVSWWGPNNQYIRLSYGQGYTPAGEVAFSTTLNFGIY